MMRYPLIWAGVRLLVGVAAAAQQPPVGSGNYAPRAVLTEELASLDHAVASPVYSPALKARAAARAGEIRLRLGAGDFRVGDRVLLRVEGEASLTDTFTVTSRPALELPIIGEVPLSGVLRAELESHLVDQVRRFIRDPRVRAQPLIRVAVLGGVSAPGFYTVPADALLTDLLVHAGGAGDLGRLDGMRIERDGRSIVDGESIAVAIRDGQTLDEIGVRAGDQVFLPIRGRGIGGAEGSLRALSIVLSIPFTIIALAQLF